MPPLRIVFCRLMSPPEPGLAISRSEGRGTGMVQSTDVSVGVFARSVLQGASCRLVSLAG